MQNAANPLPPQPHFAWRRWMIAPLVLAALAATLAWWLHDRGEALAREQTAKSELNRLGALVVMDADRKHVGSVNLSTLKSPQTLDEAIELLRPLARISSLNATGTMLQDAHARTIGQLTSLQDLVLSHTAITDTAVEYLQGLSRLKAIHVADTGLTNACLPALSRLRALTVVDLSGTKVTGNFEPFRDLANLNWLVVRRMSLDAAGIAAIGDCENLSRLTLIGTTCPAEAVQKLAEKRPNLSIEQ